MTIREAKERALRNAFEDITNSMEDYLWMVVDLKVREPILSYFDKSYVFIDAPSEEEEEYNLKTFECLDDVYTNLLNYDEYKKGFDYDLIIRIEGECKDIEKALYGIDDVIISYDVVELGNDDCAPEIEWRID